LTDQSS